MKIFTDNVIAGSILSLCFGFIFIIVFTFSQTDQVSDAEYATGLVEMDHKENSSNAKSFSERNYTWQHAGLTSILCSLIIVTVIGNALIISIVITTKKLRTVTNCFIMSLAVADWLVGAFSMPMGLIFHVTGSWEFGWLMCDIWLSVDVCLCTASILSLCAISIDRFFSITQPLNYSRKLRSKSLALLMVLIAWLLAITIACPPLYGKYDESRHSNKTCEYKRSPVYIVFSAVGSFFLPLAIILYVYLKISRIIARRHFILQKLSQPTQKRESNEINRSEIHKNVSFKYEGLETNCPHSNFNSRTSYSDNLIQDLRNVRVSSHVREHMKTPKTLLVVIGGFVLCWLPFFCIYVLNAFLPSGLIPTKLFIFLTWLGWLNSTINPFIYAICCPDFRSVLWRITLRKGGVKKQEAQMLCKVNISF